MAQNEATLNVVDVDEGENNLTSQGCQSGVWSTSKKYKSRRNVGKDKNALKEVVDAVDKTTDRLTETLLRCANQSSLKDDELLEHLVEIGIEDDDDKLISAQTFLLENPTKLRVFNSFPPHRRKGVLMKMLQDAAN